jgi:hypothetical protein
LMGDLALALFVASEVAILVTVIQSYRARRQADRETDETLTPLVDQAQLPSMSFFGRVRSLAASHSLGDLWHALDPRSDRIEDNKKYHIAAALLYSA